MIKAELKIRGKEFKVLVRERTWRKLIGDLSELTPWQRFKLLFWRKKNKMQIGETRHAEVMYYEHNTECDMCDKKSSCIIIKTLGTDCLCICIDCLENIVKESGL